MNSQNLMVIDPALEVPELESFNGIVARSPIKATYHLPALHSPVSMHEQIKDTRGIILMGSAASVLEKHEWMNDIEKVINKQLKNNFQYLVFALGTSSWLIYLEEKLTIYGILQKKGASERFKL